jgi:endonuclease/exonuclease/phosphatase family metal-dependent hydrolase
VFFVVLSHSYVAILTSFATTQIKEMLRWSLPRINFRTTKIQDCSSLVISKKEVEVDHIVVDASALVGVGLRLAKTVQQETRRQKEVGRHVAQHIYGILGRFHPRSSLAVFMDGSEILWKAHKTRTSPSNKKSEHRASRLPGTAVVQAVDDKLCRMVPGDSRAFPPEVVYSGPYSCGSVEQKISAWALDVCSRDNFKPTDSVLMIGGTELFLNSLALTPFYNISSAVQNNADFRQINVQDLLVWLDIDKEAAAGDNAFVARVRTDATLLYCLFHGASVSELSALPSLSFVEVFQAYLSEARGNKAFLFEERGNELYLDVPLLVSLLSKVLRKTPTSTPSSAAADYLELALQTHAMLCSGILHQPRFTLRDPTATSPAPIAFLNHLHSLGPDAKVCASRGSQTPSPTDGPLTAAEFTVLSQQQPQGIETSVTQLIGRPLKPEAARSILLNTNMTAVVSEVRNVLCCGTRPSRALYFSPSYCWLQNLRSKVWSFAYVDLGERSQKLLVRSKRNEEAGASLTVGASKDGPVAFNPATSLWETVSFPLASQADLTKPKSLTLLTWNVMFDRYSGKPTPLGMPGIDWCSPKRYPVLSKLIRAEDADVVGMQEVEEAFWDHLAQQPWVRENYIMSCNVDGPAVSPWGVLMMVHKRVPIAAISHLNIPAWSGHINLMPVITVDMAHGPVHVSSMHLLAPYTKSHEDARSGQDNALKQRLRKSISGDSVVMGDFNDWPTSEFVMEPDTNYQDAWVNVNPKDLGKTMDETNEFAKLKIEELFFGRSDKVFYRSKKLKPTKAYMVGTKSVNKENNDNAAPGYLFPSDHYGVKVHFTT